MACVRVHGLRAMIVRLLGFSVGLVSLLSATVDDVPCDRRVTLRRAARVASPGPRRRDLVHRGEREPDRTNGDERRPHRRVPRPGFRQPAHRHRRRARRAAVVHAGGGNEIGAITTGGQLTEYGGLTAPADGIAVGPDQNLWFTEFSLSTGTSRIGRMTTAGGIIDQYPLPSGSEPGDISLGPDGRLWFTEPGINSIGAINTSGSGHSLRDSDAGQRSIRNHRLGRSPVVHRTRRQQDRSHRDHRGDHQRVSGGQRRALWHRPWLRWSALVSRRRARTRSAG